MAEFRYQGVSMSGGLVQGVLMARNRTEAKKRLKELGERQKVKFTAVQKKVTFTYKAQLGNEKPITGEQLAFSKEEVENGLLKLNYRVLRVERKLLDLKIKPPPKDIALFVRICADLLRQKLPYDEILNLLAEDTSNRTLSKSIREIQKDLRQGKEGNEVYGKQAHVLGRFPAYMMGVASKSGNMAEVYESTAKFLERDEEFKKSLRSALIMPTVVILVLLGAIAYYVGYIFPSMAELFIRFDIELPPMTEATLNLSYFLQDNSYLLTVLFLAPVVAALLFLRTDRGRFLFDRTVIKIPVVGTLFHKTSIEIFSRLFYALYSGSGENIGVIRVAAEGCRNRYIETQVKDVAIPLMLKEGIGLVEALERTGVFTGTAISRLRSGQESGSLRESAIQLADYYERETSYRMKNVVELMNILISLFIMVVMTGLTLVSSETAVVRPKSPLMR